MITMHPVKSSNVDAVGFDDETNELHVLYKNGGHYVYEGVAKSIHDNVLAADSIGGFLAANIKHKFKWRKLRNEAEGKSS